MKWCDYAVVLRVSTIAVSKHLLKSFSSSCAPFGPYVHLALPLSGISISHYKVGRQYIIAFAIFSFEIVSEISLHVNIKCVCVVMD